MEKIFDTRPKRRIDILMLVLNRNITAIIPKSDEMLRMSHVPEARHDRRGETAGPAAEHAVRSIAARPVPIHPIVGRTSRPERPHFTAIRGAPTMRCRGTPTTPGTGVRSSPGRASITCTAARVAPSQSCCHALAQAWTSREALVAS